MESSIRQSEHGRVKTETFEKSLPIIFLLLADLAALFLAGGPRQGGEGIFLAAAGLVLIFFPAPRAVSWGWWLLGLLLLFSACSSLLTPCSFSWIDLPAWRKELSACQSLSLPNSFSLEPCSTLFWILVMGASVMTALYLLATPLSDRAMERLALIAVLGSSAYAIVAWIAWKTDWHYPFFIKEEWMQPAYGFFPNRNHTAGFLLTGAILSLGLIYRGITGGRMLLTLVASASIALLVSMLLFFSISRGGVIFLIVGVFLWVVGLGSLRSRWLIAGTAIMAAITLFFFLNSESGLLSRLKEAAPDATPAKLLTKTTSDASPTFGLRVAIWRDTLGMSADFPFTGTGLGSYATIYPYYAKKSFSPDRMALHAESDWLTLCAEGGIPLLLLVMGGLFVFLKGIPRLARQSGSAWPLRWAFLSAFFAELLHGLVDVPMHKPELGWWVMILGGIGIASGAGIKETRGISRHVQRAFFLIAGMGILLLGGMMIRAQWEGGSALPPFAQKEIQDKLTKAYGDGNPTSVQNAIQILHESIAKYPSAHSLYYQLGVILIDQMGDTSQGTSLFKAEQLLSPTDAHIVLEQGKALAPYDPITAIAFWKESLKRQFRFTTIDTKEEHGRGDNLYRVMIAYAAGYPKLLEQLPSLASDTPSLRLIWLESPSCSQEIRSEWMQDSTFISLLSTREQSHLLEIWWEHGDRSALARFLDSHPEMESAALSTRAQMLASTGNFESATQLLIRSFQLPLLKDPNKSDSLIRPPEHEVPDDPLAASRYYLELGNEIAARRLLGEAARKGGGDPGKLLWLKAELAVREGNWREAFEAVFNFLHATSKL